MVAHEINFDSIFSKEQLEYITQSVTQKAKEVFGDTLNQVILYGSYARGDFREWSDVDMMILADVDDLVAKRLENELLKTLSDLNYRMNILLSVITVPVSRFEYFKDDLPFYNNVFTEGVRIYAKVT